jgi:hypothetical protein
MDRYYAYVSCTCPKMAYEAITGTETNLSAELSSFAAGHQNAAFTVSGKERRPHVMIKMIGGDARWHDVNVLADQGNDITLLTQADGHATGLSQKAKREGQPFSVQGIASSQSTFNMTKTWIQIGDLAPIEIPLGVEDGQVQLEDSLLGREGAMERYVMVYTGDKVIFVDKQTSQSCGLNCAHY